MGGAGGSPCEGGVGTICDPNRKGLVFDGAGSALAVAIDSAGDVVIAGRFTEVAFDRNVLTSVGEQDVFVAKLDGVTGDVIWSRSFGTPETEQRIDLAVDNDDNVIFIGNTNTAIDFGGGPVCSEGFGQLYLVKLDASGAHVFSHCFGNPATTTGGIGLNLATKANGDIVVTGYSEDDVDLGSGLLPALGGPMFVATYGPDGQGLWSRKYGASDIPSSAEPRALAADRAGNLALLISFHGLLDFEGLAVASDDDGDGLLVKLDPGGGLLWGALLRGYFVHSDVAFGSAGEIVVGGKDIEAVVVAGRETPANGTIASFGTDGALRWVADPASRPVAVDGVGVDPDGNVLAVSRLTPGRQPAGRDLGFAAFSSDGTPLLDRNFGSAWARNVAVRGYKVAFCGDAYDDPGLDFGDGLLVPGGEYGGGVFTAWFEPWQSAAPAR